MQGSAELGLSKAHDIIRTGGHSKARILRQGVQKCVNNHLKLSINGWISLSGNSWNEQ